MPVDLIINTKTKRINILYFANIDTSHTISTYPSQQGQVVFSGPQWYGCFSFICMIPLGRLGCGLSSYILPTPFVPIPNGLFGMSLEGCLCHDNRRRLQDLQELQGADGAVLGLDAFKRFRNWSEPRKKPGLTFHDTGCLIGIRDPYNIFIMVYYNPLYNPINPGFFRGSSI